MSAALLRFSCLREMHGALRDADAQSKRRMSPVPLPAFYGVTTVNGQCYCRKLVLMAKTDSLLNSPQVYEVLFLHRSTQDFHPRNPAMCCKFCLGRAYYRLRDCWISCKGRYMNMELEVPLLQDCVYVSPLSVTGNGICVSGTCKCMRGFPEPFCSNATDTRDSEHPLPSRSTYSDHEESIDYSFMIPLFLVVVAILFCVKVFICCSPGRSILQRGLILFEEQIIFFYVLRGVC